MEVEHGAQGRRTESSVVLRRIRVTVRPALTPVRPSAAQVIRQRRSALAFDRHDLDLGRQLLHHAGARHAKSGARPGPAPDAVGRSCHGRLPFTSLCSFTGWTALCRVFTCWRAIQRRWACCGTRSHPHFDWTSPACCPDDLPLFLLQEGDARALAAQLSCGQDIAGESAFSLGMIAEFEPSLRQYGRVVLSQTLLGDGADRSGAISGGRGGRSPRHGHRLLLRRPGAPGHGVQ